MKGGKQLGQTVQQSRISIERRANMLGNISRIRALKRSA